MRYSILFNDKPFQPDTTDEDEMKVAVMGLILNLAGTDPGFTKIDLAQFGALEQRPQSMSFLVHHHGGADVIDVQVNP